MGEGGYYASILLGLGAFLPWGTALPDRSFFPILLELPFQCLEPIVSQHFTHLEQELESLDPESLFLDPSGVGRPDPPLSVGPM